jgi:RecJ-like exonuclease
MTETHTQKKGFLVESPVLESLRPKFEKAAELIRENLNKGCPIILRHHGDCDGYCGAIPVELAIESHLSRHSRDSWRLFRRMPSRTPYYDYMDVLKDLTNYYKDIVSGKGPLIIIIDSGSSEQDILALKKARLFGLKIVVVDHHEPFRVEGKSAVEQIVDVFINPHEEGGDANIVAGMLGTELARELSDGRLDVEIFPAVAGIGDKSSGKIMEDYLAVAKRKGYDAELLQALAKCIDFDSFFLGFTESSLIEDLMLGPMAEQRLKSSLMLPEIMERERRTAECLRRYSKTERIKDFGLVIVKISELIDFGSYPPQGKAVGLLFDSLKPERVIVLGIGEGSITIRTNLQEFNLNTMIGEMMKRFEYAQIEGGGHKSAGTVHFVDSSLEEILGFIRSYLER